MEKYAERITDNGEYIIDVVIDESIRMRCNGRVTYAVDIARGNGLINLDSIKTSATGIRIVVAYIRRVNATTCRLIQDIWYSQDGLTLDAGVHKEVNFVTDIDPVEMVVRATDFRRWY